MEGTLTEYSPEMASDFEFGFIRQHNTDVIKRVLHLHHMVIFGPSACGIYIV